MRILYVTSVFPKDFSKSVYGIFQRMRMWLDSIKSLGGELEILFFPPHGTEASATSATTLSQELFHHWGITAHVVLCPLEPHSQNDRQSPFKTFFDAIIGKSHHHFFSPYLKDRQRVAFEQCMQRSPDILFFQKIYSMAPASPSLLKGVRVFLDLDDVEHLRFAREISQPPHWRSKKLLYLEVPALWKDEREAIIKSECAFVCSDDDRKYLHRFMRTQNIETIPNATGWVADAPLSEEQNVIFVGNGQYLPNKVAVEGLLKNIWPLLKRMCPMTRVLIAGPGWESDPLYLHPPEGIEFLGFVPNLDDIYRRARVMCCPIRSGSGTRIKILEAASYGVPVVSTTIGAEGLELEPDVEIVIRESADELAEACAELLLDHEKASRIGVAGREQVRTLYGRDAVIEKIRRAIVKG